MFKLRGPFDAATELAYEALRDSSLESTEKASMIHILGEAEMYSGMIESAETHLKAALALTRAVGDRRLEGRVLCNLGRTHSQQTRLGEALSCLTMALAIAREVGDGRFEGIVLNAMGMAHHMQGHVEEAQSLQEAALAVARTVGDRRTEGVTLSNLGILYQNLGCLVESGALAEAALAIHKEIGNRRSEAIARAEFERRDGNVAAASVTLEEARAIAAEVKAGPESELARMLAR